jgi:hypothetical protein
MSAASWDVAECIFRLLNEGSLSGEGSEAASRESAETGSWGSGSGSGGAGSNGRDRGAGGAESGEAAPGAAARAAMAATCFSIVLVAGDIGAVNDRTGQRIDTLVFRGGKQRLGVVETTKENGRDNKVVTAVDVVKDSGLGRATGGVGEDVITGQFLLTLDVAGGC